ncbi:MAG: anti-sigma factor family protein [Planctomycetota bacterium]|jgi:predicted anti-sigma-YlaC factor YlaD
MNCEKCKELLVAYLEDVLERSHKQAIESHLNTCPPCRAEADEIISLRGDNKPARPSGNKRQGPGPNEPRRQSLEPNSPRAKLQVERS